MSNLEGYGTPATSFEESSASVIATARDRINEARRQFAGADVKVRDFVLEHPFVALVGALAVGYTVGRVLRKL